VTFSDLLILAYIYLGAFAAILHWQSIFLNISKSSQKLTLKLYNVVSELSAISVLFVLFLDQLPGSEYIPAAPKAFGLMIH